MNETDGEPWLSGLRMRDDAIAVNRPCPQNLMGLGVRFAPNRWLTTELSGDSAELAKLAEGFVADLAGDRLRYRGTCQVWLLPSPGHVHNCRLAPLLSSPMCRSMHLPGAAVD